MQDLRLIGVHEDGAHLILGDSDGNRYRVPLDEPLRAAARRDRPRLGQLQIEIEGGLRPRDVQAMIRAGLTAEETAERAGWTVEKVHRYEGPILAEREHVANLARQVRLRGRGAAAGATTLGDRVEERLHSRQIDTAGVRWDSRREDPSRWTLMLYFNAGGRQRQAEWAFDPLARTTQPVDDEARWLSEDDDATSPGPIPAPHLSGHGASQVYDVEAEGGVAAPSRRGGDAQTVDLMATMRQRSAQRGRRRRPKASDAPGSDRAPDDALPLTHLAIPVEDAGSPPAAHPHPKDNPDARAADDAGDDLDTAPVAEEAVAEQPDTGQPAGESVDTEPSPDLEDPRKEDPPPPAEPTPLPSPRQRGPRRPTTAPREPEDPAREADSAPAPAGPGAPPSRGKRPPARRSGRPSVPSWDDIMFGKRSD